MKPASVTSLASLFISLILLPSAFAESSNLGLFSGQTDVDNPFRAGSAQYDSEQGNYVIAGGGGNMWFTNDSFHFLWKQMSGDLTLAAAVRWSGTNGNAHRKACLVIRQTLEPDSAYVDVAVHGN